MISVIVISYNAEHTIARCINSILNQTYIDFELIIINDGSTDHTLDVIKDCTKNDSRVIICTRRNMGVAFTRQEGLDIASGEYTVFVDSDDWVEPDFLESLYECAVASNSDMVICDMLVEHSRKTEYLCEEPKSLQADVILGQMIYELHGSLCNKLILKSVYDRTEVRFLPDLDCCEDQYVVMALLSKNISVSYLDRALYHYDKSANDTSITNNWLDFPVKQRIYFIKSIEPFIINDNQKKYYNNYIGRIAYDAVASSKKACPNYALHFKDYVSQIKQSDLPKYKKIICFLAMNGILVPIRLFKDIRKSIQKIICTQ